MLADWVEYLRVLVQHQNANCDCGCLLTFHLLVCLLFYFSDEEDCFPSRSYHPYSENCKNVPGCMPSQTSVGGDFSSFCTKSN